MCQLGAGKHTPKEEHRFSYRKSRRSSPALVIQAWGPPTPAPRARAHQWLGDNIAVHLKPFGGLLGS
eukprot:15437735-Alexandrium_andersonii.AAC.1